MCLPSPKAPAPPPLPKAPPPPATPAEPVVTKAGFNQRRQAALASGVGGTVLTSSLGLTTEASTSKKKLLGA